MAQGSAGKYPLRNAAVRPGFGKADFRASEVHGGSRPADILPVSRLSEPGGISTAGARDLAGQNARLWGYVSPTAKTRRFLLSEESASYCQMCGVSHSGGPSVMLHCLDDSLAGISDIEPVAVSGKISVRPPGPHTFFEPQVVLLDVKPLPENWEELVS